MTKAEFRARLEMGRLYIDGGMGTILLAAGLRPGEKTEAWNVSHSETVTAVHKAYIDAGADVITTNTFGLSHEAPENVAPLAAAAMQCAENARKAAGRDTLIAFDIGPTGRLLRPFGDLDVEDAVEMFARPVREAVRLGADLIIIETMSDMLETKAAVLAAKENSDLPVLVTNAYDGTGKLTTGGSPLAVLAMLEGLGCDAVGVNCSTGPDELLPIVKEYLENASVPVIVSPNAGLPTVKGGVTVYDLGADAFSDTMIKMAEAGALLLGGCCGTTPEYIRLTVEKTKNIPAAYPTKKTGTLVSSYTHAVSFDGAPVLIGERINPTGKKKIKEALLAGNDDALLAEGIRQVECGATVLDVNAGLPGINEKETLRRLVPKLQSVTDVPLQIDTVDPAALEAALRVYAGKPLINSVSGREDSMRAVLPLVKHYGGAVIALTMDESGIPASAEGRLAVARRIVERAEQYGIDRKDIIVDPLTLTVSAEPEAARVTLEAIRLCREELGVKTSLGVSNISFGLPARDKLNASFFTPARGAGLSAAIMNPFSAAMNDAYRASLVLLGLDEGCRGYVAYATATAEPSAAPQTKETAPSLREAIERGLGGAAAALTRGLLETKQPLDVISEEIVPALSAVGERFEKGTFFLPQLLSAADAASASFAVIREVLPPTGDGARRIVLATVKGDIHDIGKNIVGTLLENFGFTVQDLGRDVDPAAVAAAAVGCRLVGLSALMTTTVPAMEETIRLIRASSPETKIVVGGAVLTADYAAKIGADFYAADAMETVRIAQRVFA
ncbi:MAG: homocysteine S-methyltransferase family protein [Clostridia bacterium]|nr:homocysteine S-methyltransferase family protein [Clostridia bacterium]